MKYHRHTLRLAALALALALGACSSKDSELEQFIAQTKVEPGGRVEPIPELKPYDTIAYNGTNRRSPFLPGGSGNSSSSNVRPTSNRNREFLEQFPLDTLKFVGTIHIGQTTYGLLKVTDGRVHRVTSGNYVGQNDGRILAITPSKISVSEVIPDGLGGYMERPAAISLSE
jgi:type IV pilus assembly protein PilP